jgi:hypothetical protein
MKAIWRCASTLLATALCVAARADSSTGVPDQEQVIDTVRQMFVALSADDLGQFRAVTAPDFYAFDGGKRFTGDELMELLKKLHAAGTTLVWQVTEPQAYVDGQTAWMTWINRGSIGDAAGKTELTWLESAVLRRTDGTWRIHFLHSTRAAPP